MSRKRLALVALFFLLFAAGLISCFSFHGSATLCRMPAPALNEVSGLAISQRDPRIVWAHNDSGDGAFVYAVEKSSGKLLGKVCLNGVSAMDWEDMASFTLDGRPLLLLADVGDNASQRKEVVLWVIEEPAPSSLKASGELRVEPLLTIRLRYEDGPKDCEAVAVDVAEGKVFLISKRTHPPVLYSVPLRSGSFVAHREAQIQGLDEPSLTAQSIPLPSMRFQSQPTGLDIRGNRAALLTYGRIYLYEKQPDESWAKAFARKPRALASPHLPQAESICFDADSSYVIVSSEGLAEALLRIKIP